MQLQILQKILKNQEISEITTVIKDNLILNDVIQNVKEQYFIKDEIHGIKHNERVVLLACYIGIKEKISDEELKILLNVALYHDIGRGYEKNHGKVSAELIEKNKEYIFPNVKSEDIQIIKALCECHSNDDNKYEKIAKNYGINNINQFKKILEILKDADALDRVRLPKYGKLKVEYLRTNTAKKLPDISEKLYKIHSEIEKESKNKEQKVFASQELDVKYVEEKLKKMCISDEESYYLIRSLNKNDITDLNNENSINPKVKKDEYTLNDVLKQVKMRHNKTCLISLTDDANVALTYDRANLQAFALIKVKKENKESLNMFHVGDYLLNEMEKKANEITKNAPDKVKEEIEKIEKSNSVEEVVKVINGKGRDISTNLIENNYRYLTEKEQLNQAKQIAKCKILHYYGLMREIEPNIGISEYVQIMRSGYSSSEWLNFGEIEKKDIIITPKILIDALGLVRQAEFYKDEKSELKKLETEILKMIKQNVISNSNEDLIDYSIHNNEKSELDIDKVFNLSDGKLSYRDSSLQILTIKSLAEMELNKRIIINLLSKNIKEINIEEVLKNSYCINREIITRQNNKGNQIGKNIGLLVSDYGYEVDETTTKRLIESVQKLSTNELKEVIEIGIDSEQIKRIFMENQKDDKQRIQINKNRTVSSKYMVESIVEGYNWRRDGNSLTSEEKELIADKLLTWVSNKNELHKVYRAISKTQIGKTKFTQNDIFGIIINIAIAGKIGDVSWKDFINAPYGEVQNIILKNKYDLQTTVLPISIDLFVGKGTEVNRLKSRMLELGIDKEFIEKKNIKNVYVAEKIVENYDFGRELSKEEKKGIIYCILDISILNEGKHIYLSNLVNNLQKSGFNMQEVYGEIIKLGINGNLLDNAGTFYSHLVTNRNNVLEIIKKRKDEVIRNSIITDMDIIKAQSQAITNEEKMKLETEMHNLGIDKEFLKEKDIRNIYIAKYIVNNYNFDTMISDDIKGKIIYGILNNSNLNGPESNNENVGNCYISSLMQRFEKLNLNNQEIEGLIIKIGLGGKIAKGQGFDYGRLLQNIKKTFDELENRKDELIKNSHITEGDFLKLKTNSTDDIKNVMKRLQKLGIEKDFLEQKDEKNVIAAEYIVENYKFKRKLSNNEKGALIYGILDRSFFNKNKKLYLATLVQTLEKSGLDNQTIYGGIIKLGINGFIIDKMGYAYNELIRNMNDCCTSIEKYKSEFKEKSIVDDANILKSCSKFLNNKKQKKLHDEMCALGLDEKFVKSKKIENIYIANQIVNDYNFNRKLSNDDRRGLLYEILNNKLLETKSSYISNVIQDMEYIGIDKQVIYGMIMKLAIYDKIIQKEGISYSRVLGNANARLEISEYKNELEKNSIITAGDILRASAQSIDEKQRNEIKRRVQEIGIDESFLENYDIKNIYVAEQIVERYVYNRNLSDKEKSSMIYCILNNKTLQKRGIYLTGLISSFGNIENDEQKIYETIIKYGIDGSICDEKGYNYSKALSNPNRCSEISEIKWEKIRNDIRISEIDILKSKSKSLSLGEMKNLKAELENIGLNESFIKNKGIENVYVANEVISGYDFERKINNEEKKMILERILRSSALDCKRKKLSCLMQNIESTGLTTKEVYGLILKLGICGKIINTSGFNYGSIISNSNDSIKKMKDNIDEIKKNIVITENDIEEAMKGEKIKYKINGEEIVKSTIGLLKKGGNGSKICDDVKKDYTLLIEQKKKKSNEVRDKNDISD